MMKNADRSAQCEGKTAVVAGPLSHVQRGGFSAMLCSGDAEPPSLRELLAEARQERVEIEVALSPTTDCPK